MKYTCATSQPWDRKWRVSTDGGWQPHWRRDGRELFYLTQDGTLMAVELKAKAAKDGAEFDFGAPGHFFARVFDRIEARRR